MVVSVQRCERWATPTACEDAMTDTDVTLTRQPKTHDYTVRAFGHDYSFTPIDRGLRGSIHGWGVGALNERMEAGDYILLQNGEDSTRYRFTRIRYETNPPDQWFGEVEFAPRH